MIFDIFKIIAILGVSTFVFVKNIYHYVKLRTNFSKRMIVWLT